MIRDSWHWKHSLSKDADLLETWAEKTKFTERRSALIERKVMVSAFSIRKLHESGKLSSAFADRSTQVRVFQRKPGRVEPAFDYDLDKEFKMNCPVQRRHPVMKVLDQIIHSRIFYEGVVEGGAVESFIVASDRTSSVRITEVSISEFLRIMRAAAHDDPETLVALRSQISGKWLTWRGTGEMPRHVKANMEAALRRRKSYGASET